MVPVWYRPWACPGLQVLAVFRRVFVAAENSSSEEAEGSFFHRTAPRVVADR